MKTKRFKVIILSIFIIIFTLSLVGCDSPSSDDHAVPEEPVDMNITFILEDEETGDYIEDANVLVEDHQKNEQQASYTEDGRYVLENISLMENEAYKVIIRHQDYEDIEDNFTASDNLTATLEIKPLLYYLSFEINGVMKSEHASLFSIQKADGDFKYSFNESDYISADNSLYITSEDLNEDFTGQNSIELIIENHENKDFYYSVEGDNSKVQSVNYNNHDIEINLDDTLKKYSELKGSMNKDLEIYLVKEGQLSISNYSSADWIELEDRVKTRFDGARNVGEFNISKDNNFITENNGDILIDFSELNLMDHRTDNYGAPIEFKLFNESDNILGTITVEVETINN